MAGVIAAGLLVGPWGITAVAPSAFAGPPATASAGVRTAASTVGVTPLSYDVMPWRTDFDADAQRAALGRRIFFDPALSVPAGTSCASCHDPRQAYTGNHGSANGVSAGSRPGHFARRNAPSLLYVRYTPALYMYQDEDATAPEPRGGLFADGRADSIAQAVASPLMDADEMNNHDAAGLARRLAKAGYREAFRRATGDDPLDDPSRAIQQVGQALQAYLDSDEMAPFTSRFDDFLRGRARLTDAERRGLKLFKDPDKGNCASCHVMVDTSSDPTRSLFTDFGYDAIAVPRNRALPATQQPTYFDLGLCRTGERLGWPDPDQWCGYFKTPTLRNVAIHGRLMHNGVFASLRDAVRFYATRSVRPADWYRDGTQFDDLPAAYRANVNVNSVPLNRRPGAAAALSDDEIDDIVAFLGTLTDAAYRASAPSAPLSTSPSAAIPPVAPSPSTKRSSLDR